MKKIKQRIAYSISNTAVFCALLGVFSALGNMELGNCCTVRGMIIALFSMAVFIISACLSNAISECMEREKRAVIEHEKTRSIKQQSLCVWECMVFSVDLYEIRCNILL